jgi:hypothetical protein
MDATEEHGSSISTTASAHAPLLQQFTEVCTVRTIHHEAQLGRFWTSSANPNSIVTMARPSITGFDPKKFAAASANGTKNDPWAR